MSMICCLEDSIRDDQVDGAERNLVRQVRRLADRQPSGPAAGPLLFVRVRTADQILRIAEGLGDAIGVLSGFVLPKFRADRDSTAQLTAIRQVGQCAPHRLFAMPILESPEVAHAETRLAALLEARHLLESHREHVLAVRVGATDLSGVFALRRPVDLTAWDLAVISGVLTDIINVFTRRDGSGFIVSGPVWEYFDRRGQTGSGESCLEGLAREARLDRANGLLGKTVIHPSHAAVVHAQAVVGHEEYCDAAAICVETDGTGGVLRSVYGNKMNEVRPHRAWAGRTLQRAAVFGVAAQGVGPGDLLRATADRKALV